MAKVKYDGIVEAVRYRPDGQVDWVRTFLRRGPTFSDFILLDRQTLIDHLKAGKKYFVGRRVPQMASTFEVTTPLQVIDSDGKAILVTGGAQAQKDCLEGVPQI